MSAQDESAGITNAAPNYGAQGVFYAPVTVVQAPVPAAPRLHQLRPPVGDFTGRTAELTQLVAAFRLAASGGGAAIAGIRGMGGLGKSELAYAVAQQLITDFPDAQLVLSLRGASANPLTPVAMLTA